ncbi:MAG: insulinase family protein, partial [Deltaproteobacteria bacterium]
SPAVPPLATPAGYRVVLVDKPERSQTQVFIGHTTLDANHADYLPLLIAQTVFGGTFTARVSHEIREKRGWSYGAYSYLSTDRHLGTFTIRFYPSVADTLPAIQLADELFRDLVARGVTSDELEFARDYLANGHAFSIDTAERRLSELMSARLQGRPDGWVDGFVDAVRAVTPEQVDAALKRHFTPESLITSVVATASDLRDAITAWPRVSAIEDVDYREPAYP